MVCEYKPRTWEQEVTSLIPGSADIFSKDTTGFIPLSLLSIVTTMAMWESSQLPGKNIVQRTGQKDSRKARISALEPRYLK